MLVVSIIVALQLVYISQICNRKDYNTCKIIKLKSLSKKKKKAYQFSICATKARLFSVDIISFNKKALG